MAGGNRPAIAGVALPDLQSRRGEGQWFGSLVFNLGMRGAPELSAHDLSEITGCSKALGRLLQNWVDRKL